MCTTVALVIFDALEFGKEESGQNYQLELTMANDGKHLQTSLKSFESFEIYDAHIIIHSSFKMRYTCKMLGL